jgi:hypothetical protein
MAIAITLDSLLGRLLAVCEALTLRSIIGSNTRAFAILAA